MNNTSTLWEENDSTEQSQKSVSKLTFALNNGINETNNVSVESVCENIGNKKRWIKLCPSCGGKQCFDTEGGFKYGLKHNTYCPVCKSRTKHNYVGMKFGKITIINQYYLPNGKNLRVDYSCDCGHKTINRAFGKVKNQRMCIKCSTGHNGLKHGRAAFNSLYDSYMRNAKRRLLEFKLTEDEFGKLTQQNCFYCGGSPNCIICPKSVRAYVYNGIDRRDNTKGYIKENCVPCCKFCNFAKYEFSESEFFNHIKKIYDYSMLNKK